MYHQHVTVFWWFEICISSCHRWSDDSNWRSFGRWVKTVDLFWTLPEMSIRMILTPRTKWSKGCCILRRWTSCQPIAPQAWCDYKENIEHVFFYFFDRIASAHQTHDKWWLLQHWRRPKASRLHWIVFLSPDRSLPLDYFHQLPFHPGFQKAPSTVLEPKKLLLSGIYIMFTSTKPLNHTP